MVWRVPGCPVCPEQVGDEWARGSPRLSEPGPQASAMWNQSPDGFPMGPRTAYVARKSCAHGPASEMVSRVSGGV